MRKIIHAGMHRQRDLRALSFTFVKNADVDDVAKSLARDAEEWTGGDTGDEVFAADAAYAYAAKNAAALFASVIFCAGLRLGRPNQASRPAHALHRDAANILI
jgi:hypothetical protein